MALLFQPSASRRSTSSSRALSGSQAALREAHRRGYRVGTLQSTPAGRSVYLGLGFRELAPCDCYIWEPEQQIIARSG